MQMPGKVSAMLKLGELHQTLEMSAFLLLSWLTTCDVNVSVKLITLGTFG